MHMPLEQQPVLHVFPAQHGAPVSPQIWHRADELELDEQTVPGAQRSVPLLPEQHCSPAWPQAEQTLLRHARPSPQLLPQHGWPESPQFAQWPDVHTPPPLPPEPVTVLLPQLVPSATQVSL